MKKRQERYAHGPLKKLQMTREQMTIVESRVGIFAQDFIDQQWTIKQLITAVYVRGLIDGAQVEEYKTSRDCQAKQFSDTMVCERCALVWDMNDPSPPECQPLKGLNNAD